MALRGGHGPYSIINYSWHLRLPTLRDNARLHSSTVAWVFPVHPFFSPFRFKGSSDEPQSPAKSLEKD
ncbi:unnamed protein product [Arctogadus glacialis]